MSRRTHPCGISPPLSDNELDGRRWFRLSDCSGPWSPGDSVVRPKKEYVPAFDLTILRVVLEERIETNGIPAKLYHPPGAEGLLLLGHGGTKSKDSDRFVALSRLYAESTGLAVVCIDAVDHGERRLAVTDGPLPAEWHSNAIGPMVSDWVEAAKALSWIGPPVAYVGFSMGAIFGVPTVGSLASIKAAVFVVGGIPAGGGIQDPPLRPLLLDAASKLDHSQILMVNQTQDEIFPVADVHELFDAIPGSNKRLMFWEGKHDDWSTEAIDYTIAFINSHVGRGA
jgi:dienelactone hydrolase